MIVRPCEQCGVEFDAESANAKNRRHGKLKRFCSRRCRNLSRPKLPERTAEYFQRPCGVCGLVFDATPSRPQYEQPRKYCRKCVNAGRKAKIQQFHAHCNITLQCESCGQSFSIPRRLVKSGKHAGRYCSLRCANVGKVGKAPAYSQQPHAQGTKRINKQGYVQIKIDDKDGWMLEHRHAMGQIMGRPLHPWENVHHKDGDRQHNSQDNLELWIKTQPTGMRFEDLTEIYGAELLAARLRIHELETMLSHRSR